MVRLVYLDKEIVAAHALTRVAAEPISAALSRAPLRILVTAVDAVRRAVSLLGAGHAAAVGANEV